MIKITGINRRVRVDRKEGEKVTDSHTCNAVLAVDPFILKDGKRPFTLHVELTEQEAELYDTLCTKIEERLVVDLANQEKPAPQPVVESEQLLAEVPLTESAEPSEDAAAAATTT